MNEVQSASNGASFGAKAKSVLGKIGQSVRAIASAVCAWWRKGDSYQQRAQGWAVTGFVFCLLNIFSLGLLPALSYLAIVCCAVALFAGNRAVISPLGIVLGVVSIALSTRLYDSIFLYYTDAEAFKTMLTDFMTAIQSTIAGLV